MQLKELFFIKNGVSSSNVSISLVKNDTFHLPYIRPSQTFRRTIAGYVDPNSIDGKYIFPSETIFVSTDGQGSHSYSYVSPFKFVPNSNVVALIPKKTLTLKEKIFYATCITKNRWLFSYARKPKRKRLGDLILPDKAPDWVNSTTIQKSVNISDSILKKSMSLKDNKWGYFNYPELFEIKKGQRIINCDIKPGKTPFIRPLKHSNGYSARIRISPNHQGNTITVNYDSEGGVGEAFYQPIPYFAIDSVNVFYPKFKLDIYIAMFLITLIRRERFRYSYGRKWHLGRMNISKIKLPVTDDGKPDWKFMRDYIKSLPYSKGLS